MNHPATPADRQLLRDLAVARANDLRRQAIRDFWATAARLPGRAAAAWRRRLQTAEVA